MFVRLNKIRLVFTFYRSFAVVSNLVTMACLSILYANGIKTFTTLFWFKMATLAILVLYIRTYKKQAFYYYRNLGLTPRGLWIASLLADILVFIVLTILILYVR